MTINVMPMRDMIKATRPGIDSRRLEELVFAFSKDRCRAAVQYAIKHGLLAKGQICEGCTLIPKRIVGHHDDYSRPLFVRWLCTRCHGEWHSSNTPKPLPSDMLGLEMKDYLRIGMDQLGFAPQEVNVLLAMSVSSPKRQGIFNRRNMLRMSRAELETICDAVGGPKVIADFVPATLRAVDHWRAGTRGIRPPVEARIRELHRQHTGAA